MSNLTLYALGILGSFVFSVKFICKSFSELLKKIKFFLTQTQEHLPNVYKVLFIYAEKTVLHGQSLNNIPFHLEIISNFQSTSCQIECFLHSYANPDLTLLDVFFRGHVKNLMYADILARTWKEVNYHLYVCHTTNII